MEMEMEMERESEEQGGMEMPEGCIANILSFTTPLDAFGLSLVSKTFCSASQSDALWDRFLPSDYHAIVSQCPSFSSASSKKALYLALSDPHHPLIIDDGKKSFQLDRRTGKKCYMLAARDLSITWGDTPRYWSWTTLPESRFQEVAVLLHVCWLEIRGKINTLSLSSDTQYAAYLVFKMIDADGFLYSPVKLSVGTHGDHSRTRNVCLEPSLQESKLPRRLRGLQRPKERSDGWLEIEMGEFFSSGLENEEVEMCVMEIKGGNWKRGLFVQGIEVRPKELTRQISSILIPKFGSCADCWIWSGNMVGDYTTANSYKCLLQRHRNWNSDESWSWLWKLKAPQRMIFLVWLILHNALPTNSLRHRRGLALNSGCSRCSVHNEDVLHCLRDCPHSREIWCRLGFDHYPPFLNNNLTQWVKSFLKDTYNALFLSSLWWCWRWRNTMTFDAERWTVDGVLHRIYATYQDIVRSFSLTTQPVPSIPRQVQWCKRIEEYVKVNTDGSCLGTLRRAGVGGVLRNSDGAWIHGFFGSLGDADIVLAELLALRIGLNLAWDLGYKKTWCEIDSLEVLRLVSDNSMSMVLLLLIFFT